MLSSVSWPEYITAILIILAIYYALIGYRFYKHDLLALTTNAKQPQTFAIAQFQAQAEIIPNPKDTPTVESFADEIKAYLQEATNGQFEKHTVVYGLSCIANKYAALKVSEYRFAIRELIASEIENYCAFILNDEEMSKVWSIDSEAGQV